MRQKKGRFFPYLCQKLIQIIGAWRAVSGPHPHMRRNRRGKPELTVVDKLPFLPFLHSFNRQAQLLIFLIYGVIEYVRNIGIHPQYGLHQV